MNKATVVTAVTENKYKDIAISKNIQKRSSGIYRIRVCGDTEFCTSKKQAFATRKQLFAKHGK